MGIVDDVRCNVSCSEPFAIFAIQRTQLSQAPDVEKLVENYQRIGFVGLVESVSQIS